LEKLRTKDSVVSKHYYNLNKKFNHPGKDAVLKRNKAKLNMAKLISMLTFNPRMSK
jgi:hypothetical protein